MSVIYGNPIITNGGGVKLNIDYGSTPPSDTSKLWVPLSGKPDKVECSPLLAFGNEYFSDFVQFDSGTSYSSIPGSWGHGFLDGDYIYWWVATQNLARFNIKTKAIDAVKTNSLITNMSNPSSGSVCCQVGRKVYLAASQLSVDSTNRYRCVFEIDLDTKLATLLGQIPYDSEVENSIMYMEMVHCNGKLYFFGGIRQSYANVSNQIKIFDLETKTSSVSSAVLSNQGRYYSACVVGANIFIMGGAKQANAFNQVYKYDTLTDTISVVASYPQTVAGMTLISTNKYIYCFGGATGYFNNSTPIPQIDKIYKFDTESYQFSELDITLPQRSMFIVNYKESDNKYYLCAPNNATSGSGYPPTTTTLPSYYDVFNVSSPLTENHLFLQEDFGTDSLWSALKSKDTDLKVKVINAYLGDSNNIAQLTNAYLYDTASSQWKSLSGESYVADMQNALNILGVT